MSTPTTIAEFLQRLGPVEIEKLDEYPIKTNVDRDISGDMVNSAFQDFANLVADLLAAKQGVLTFDNTPAAGSSNPVTSAGIAAAITNQIAAALVGYVKQPQVAAAITAALAPYSTTAQTAQQIAQAITTALASYSTTAQMQTAITGAINTALAAYDTHAEVVQEIADAITAALTDYVTGEQMTTAIAAALADYVTTEAMNTALAGKQNKLTAMGSATKPVYVYADGTLAPCDDYAGGTKVVLNGEDKGGKSISIYAPTGKGNAGQYYGSKAPDAPGWVTPDNAPTEGSGKLVKSGGVFSAIANAAASAVQTVKEWAQGIFARIDGYYQTLTSGAAENLVGRGTTPAVISFRPAGGTQDIGSGAASIAKIKGRTDAWNQKVGNGNFESVKTWSTTRCTYTVANGVASIVVNNGESNGYIYQSIGGLISGHKYLFFASIKAADANKGRIYTEGGTFSPEIDSYNSSTDWQNVAVIKTASASGSASLLIRNYDNANALLVKSVAMVDLTLMCGAGREPATSPVFLAEYPEALAAPFNAGKLINNKLTALVTDGFNQWDEVAEIGSIDANGNNVALTDRLRSKNYMPVFPNTAYHFKTPNALGVYWYDINKAFISSGAANNTTLTAPANAYYLRFYIVPSYGTTYKNDIAINLHHSGIRDGEYEPYWKSTLNLDHSKIYGKLNGAGDMVQIAPYGFRGVGSNYDEVDIVRKEAYIRRAQVDLGTLNWSYTAIGSKFATSLADVASNSSTLYAANLLCARYENVGRLNAADKKCSLYLTEFEIRDSAYTSAAAFKTAMNGVMLDYQLATPLHYTDLMYSEDGGQTFVELPSNYRVDDFGTELRLPSGIVDGAPASTPLVADIAYAMNAVDTLRRLPQTYLSKESTENLLAEMVSAGVIAGYTMTYDDTNEVYTFTITPNA